MAAPNPSGPRARTGAASGPLSGLRVVEFAGLGPAPFACMLLADMGADVVTIARPGQVPRGHEARSRRVVTANLKEPGVVEDVMALVAGADALVEGFRPGVMERLGLGPDAALARNPRLVYGRMTGWGQEGPLAGAAGHDINYIAITGALAAIGPAEAPVPPLNLVGDYGGGALYLVAGLLAALFEAARSGRGQVVDAAMCDGAASLLAMFHDLAAAGRWTQDRAANLLDGGAPFYGVYRCKDGGFVAIGALEPQFYGLLREKVGLTDPAFDAQMEEAAWPRLRERTAAIMATRTRAEWTALLEGTDACFAPVLTMEEAPGHPHMAARGTFVTRDGHTQAAPAPRFSRTASAIRETRHDTLADVVGSWREEP